MFVMNFNFLGQYPPRAIYSKMAIDEIYDYLCWEAYLNITYNDQIVFSEEIAIIEFYWYLVTWYRKFLAGQKEQFIYSTVEHTEPILVFLPRQNNCWEIDSVWRQCDNPVIIKEELLCCEVNKLLEKIMLEIEG